MIRLTHSTGKYALANKQPRLVRNPSLAYINITHEQLSPFSEIKDHINQLVGNTLNQGKQIQDIVLAIDLISTSNAISNGKAQKIAIKTLKFIDRHFPSLRDRFVGITDDEKTLPLQALMITGVLALEEIDNKHLFVME